MPPATPPRRWRVGEFEIDEPNHRLTHRGQPVALTPRPFRLLCCLLERAGELVSKDALFAAVWPGLVVSDAALSRAVHELRRALGDDAAEPRYLATVHGLGFRWLAPLERLHAGERVAPPALAFQAAFAPPSTLVGRADELAWLTHAAQAAAAGQRQLVLVSGAAGIGKTTLVEAFAHELQHRGWRLAQGRCIEHYGEREAFLPWLEVAEQLAQAAEGTLTPPGLRGPGDAERPWLHPLVQGIEAMSHRQPLLLWLEDLHWSDASSLDALAFFAGRRSAAKVLVLASLRPPEEAADPALGAASPLARTIDRLLHLGQARALHVPALGASAVRELVRQRCAAGGADGLSVSELERLAASIHRRSEGHALFAQALVDDWLLQRQPLPADEGALAQLPASLLRLLRAEFERQTEADRELLEAAAVAGVRFGAASVAAALGWPVEQAEQRLEPLARCGLLQPEPPAQRWPDGTVAAAYRFPHALRWQAVRGGVTPARCARWQARIATRLAAAHERDDAAAMRIAAELAARFEQAGDVPRCLQQVHRASTAALRRGAYPEAIALLRQGLALLPHGEPAGREAEELALRLPLGVALMAAQGYAAPEVEQTYLRALALCSRGGTPADWSRALRGLWNVRFLRGELGAAREAAERLLVQALAQDDPALALDAHVKLGQTCLHQGELAAARRHLETALASPLSTADDAGLRAAPRVAAYLAWACWYAGDDEAAAAAGDQALRWAEAVDSPHSKAFALGYVAWVRLMQGDLERTEQLASRQLALSLDVGLPYWRQLAQFLHGAAQARRGTAAGIEAMRRAIAEMQADGGEVGVPYLHCVLAESLAAAGPRGAAEAEALVRSALDRMRRHGNLLHEADAWRLLALLASGGPDRALRSRAGRCLAVARAIAHRQGALALLRRLQPATGRPSRAAVS